MEPTPGPRGTYQGWNIRDDPIIEKSQDPDQGQGQGQDHLLPQRAALPQPLGPGVGSIQDPQPKTPK